MGSDHKRPEKTKLVAFPYRRSRLSAVMYGSGFLRVVARGPFSKYLAPASRILASTYFPIFSSSTSAGTRSRHSTPRLVRPLPSLKGSWFDVVGCLHRVSCSSVRNYSCFGSKNVRHRPPLIIVLNRVGSVPIRGAAGPGEVR